MTTAELDLTKIASSASAGATMKALVYHGPGKRAWEDKPRPTIQEPSDAIVRITTSTICGTDLHILKGDLPAVVDGRILGHEGIGVVEQVGTGVSEFQVGEKVIISCVTACLKCDFCKKGMYSHCRHGGWILGYTIDGTQAEYVRIPQADGSLYKFPADGDENAMVMLSDILPTGFECGVLNGQVKPGDTVAIVGAGPVGLAVLLTAQFYSPASIFMIDLDDKRLAVAKTFGATSLINSTDGHAADHVMELTEGAGVDVAIEAVGLPATFAICQAIVAAGGHIANVGVHGKPVELHLEKLWDRNISLTTRLVDTVTTPMLLKVVRSGKLQPSKLVTHRFAMNDIMKAYDTFANAAQEGRSKWCSRILFLVDRGAGYLIWITARPSGGSVRFSSPPFSSSISGAPSLIDSRSFCSCAWVG
jgi:alcohol dehydrogenase